MVMENKIDQELVNIAKCSVCYDIYNKSTRTPISMTCGHTFCKCCVGRLNANYFLCCPICRTVSVLGHNDWCKNHALLQIMDKLGLLELDDTPVPATPQEYDQSQYIQILSSVKFKDALNYTRKFLDILKDYLVFHLQEVIDDLKSQLYAVLDEFKTWLHPKVSAFHSYIGRESLAEMFPKTEEEFDDGNGNAIIESLAQ